jgi:hypothetical protein
MGKLKSMRWAGHVARTLKKVNICRILVEKLVRKGSLRIPKRKWEDNVLKLILEK